MKGDLPNPKIGVWVADTGFARGEPNCWFVELDGVAVFEKLGQEAARKFCENAGANLRNALEVHDKRIRNQDLQTIAQLQNEVVKYRQALNAIDVMACLDRSHPVISCLAREALEESLCKTI